MVFLWWCGGVFVVVFLWWCFLWLCFCGGAFVVFVWWCFCGGVFAGCFCGGVVVFLWWCFCGGVVVFLWWCLYFVVGSSTVVETCCGEVL